MSKLMPQGSHRWCKECGHSWYTADPSASSCKYCGAPVRDATVGWPHVCTDGHGADHGGTCLECPAVARTKSNGVQHTAAVWVNRT